MSKGKALIRLHNNQKGISILEVVFALVIFSISLMGVLGMFSLGEEGSSYGDHTSLGLSLAQDKMEEKWMAPWELLLWDDLDGDGQAETKMKKTGAGVYFFEETTEKGIIRRWEVRKGASSSELTLISVTTIWTDKKGKDHIFNLRGLRAEHPMYK